MRSRFVPRSVAQPLSNEHKAKLTNDLHVWKTTLTNSLVYNESQDPETTTLETLLLEAMYK